MTAIQKAHLDALVGPDSLGPKTGTGCGGGK